MRIDRGVTFYCSLLLFQATIAPSVLAQSTVSLPTGEQRDCRRGEIAFPFPVRGLSVAPNGRLWLTDAVGTWYYADSVDGDWQSGKFPVIGKPFSMRGVEYGALVDQVSFFNADTAIAVGFIVDIAPKRGYVYRTTDGGLTWNSVVFGASEWIYDALIGTSGTAWIGGSDGHLYQTRDYGETWTETSPPFDKSLILEAIFMTQDGHGIAGAGGNALKITSDNGTTWSSITTPRDQQQDIGNRYCQAIDKVVVWGRYLVVRQCGHVFYTPSDTIRWMPLLPHDGLTSIRVDEHHRRLVAITHSLYVVALDSLLRSSYLSIVPLRHPPQSWVVHNDAVYAFSPEDGITVLSASRSRLSYPFTSARQTAAIQMQIVRWSGMGMVGVTQHHVYDSNDSGASWCRIASVPFIVTGMLMIDNRHVMLWDGHGSNMVLDRNTGQLRPIHDLRTDDIVGVIPTDSVWIAFGGKQYETAGRVDVSRTFFAGQFRGSLPYGFVVTSTDSGRTWRQVDRWDEAGVMDAGIMPNGDITLLSYLGSVRRLHRQGTRWIAQTLLLAPPGLPSNVPYVQRSYALYFRDTTTGYVGGWIHRLGGRSYRTSDGGAHWTPVPVDTFPYRRMIHTQSGYVAYTDRNIYMLYGAERRSLPVPDLQSDSTARIADVSVAGPSQLLVEMIQKDTSGKYLFPFRKRWTLLRY
jgi:photosystem II stability/assembly factor-like uncharacterized protein